MTDLPAEVKFGKVVARFLLAVGDSVDAGSEPDAQPGVGSVKFRPVVPNSQVTTPEAALVTARPPICTLDVDGRLVDSQGNQGVWLLVGDYEVTFAIKGAKISPILIRVTEAHTDLAPLLLTQEVPISGPQITPGQYQVLSDLIYATDAELSAAVSSLTTADSTLDARLDVVEAPGYRDDRYYTEAEVDALISGVVAGTVVDHGDLTGLADDDHTQYALANGSRGAFATVAQGVKADTAVQPAALAAHEADTTAVHGIADTAALVVTTDPRLSNARTPTAHTHPVADINATGTPDSTTYLRGDGTWATPAGGGGGVTDHGALTGLADDDHTQYALADGSRGLFATTAQGAKADTALQAADISGKLDTAAAPELIRDTMSTALVQGDGVTITPSDAGDTITIAANAVQTIAAKTASYTLALSDLGKLLTFDSTSAMTLSIPTDASVAFPVGSRVDALVISTGMVTVAAVTPGTTTVSGTPSLVSRAQWSALSLIKRAANAWVVVGDLA